MSNFIILNNQVIEGLEIGSIFDSEKYDIFKGVTFSIDQKFAEKHLSNFKETTIVVGIQDSDVQERGLSLEQKQIKQLVDNTKILSSGLPIKMFENFSRSIQDRILEDSYQLRIPLSKTIHTKMYLLKNSESGDTRLIIGSANLSNQAFSNTTPQLELLEIRDNSELFSEYENYFDTEIISETVDFFGNSVRKKAKSKAQKEETNVTITFTPKEFGELKVNRISEQFDQIKESVSSGKIEQTVIDELKEEAKIVDVRSKELKQEFDDVDLAVRITTAAVNVRTGNGKADVKLHENSEVKKRVSNLLRDNLLAKKVKAEVLPRDLLISRPAIRTDSNSGLSLGIKENETKAEDGSVVENFKYHKIGKKLDDEGIKKSVLLIDSIMKNYKEFVPNYTSDYGKRVIEAIAFAFTSPFLSEIRQNTSLNSEALDIPLFAVIGGTGGSGKSKLLNIINRMLGLNDMTEPTTYSELVVDDSVQKNSKTITQLKYWMLEEDNVAPLLIDELPDKFFDAKGVQFIKDVANISGKQPHLTPAFICTTNASDMVAKEEAITRRMYYLLNDRKFDDQYRDISTEKYNELFNETTDELFQDFVLRFSEILSDDNTEWKYYNHGKVDFLKNTRTIFEEYFKIAGFETLPDYFPEERVDDTNKTNITMWKRLYTAMPELFKKISDDETNQDIYILKLSDLDHNFQKDNMYSKEKKPSSVYSEALDNRVLASTRTKADLFIEFYVNQFHDWIGIPEVNSEKAEAVINSVESQTKQETSNKGFFGRLFGK
jgi:hypothetical protein